MVVKWRNAMLLSGTLLSASLLGSAAVLADDAQSDKLQGEINAMQQQLQKLQDQMAETKKEAKSAQQTAEHAEQSIPGGIYDAAGKPTGTVFSGANVNVIDLCAIAAS